MISHLIFNLIIAHILGDFYLQTNKSCVNKFRYSARGKELWIHSLLIGTLSWLAICDIRGWWLALGIMILHFFTDLLKTFIQSRVDILKLNAKNEVIPGENKRNDLWVFIADQLVHILILIIGANIWFAVNNNWEQINFLHHLITNHPLWIKTIVGLLLALKPANILILLILETCKVKVVAENIDEHGNFRSGELIGWLERGLILVFVVMSQYEAIGFLIAAKSILRFNEASKGDEKSEYVLTGTMLSLAIAICIGIVILKLHI